MQLKHIIIIEKKVGVSTDIKQFNNEILEKFYRIIKLMELLGATMSGLALLDYQIQQIKLVKSIKVETIYILSFLELLTL